MKTFHITPARRPKLVVTLIETGGEKLSHSPSIYRVLC